MSEVKGSEERRKDEVKEAILRAFADVPYPGDEAITLPPADYRTKRYNEDFKGLHFRDVPLALIKEEHVWLFLFSPAGRRFYLPAYLLMDLERLQERLGAHWVLYALEPPEEMGWFEREYGAYTEAEKQAIRLFIEYVRDNAAEPSTRARAAAALERYWAREPGTPPPPRPAQPARRAEVERAIRDAFADVPYPGDEAIGYDPHDYEGADLNRDFKGYHWRELPRDAFAYHYGDLSFFSPRGRQFYLPAYMLDSLDDVNDSVIYGFTPNDDERLDAWARERNEIFTSAQRSAIRLFLEYVRDEMPEDYLATDCRYALDECWAPRERAAPDLARKEQLQRAILDAFAEVPYPGDDRIGGLNEEMERDFRGHHFRDVPRKVLIAHSHPVGFTPAGLHHYLPAYMLAALDEAGDILYWLIRELTADQTTEERLAQFHVCFADYTPAQREAIRLFLEYVRDAMPHRSLGGLAQEALDRYWARPAAA